MYVPSSVAESPFQLQSPTPISSQLKPSIHISRVMIASFTARLHNPSVRPWILHRDKKKIGIIIIIITTSGYDTVCGRKRKPHPPSAELGCIL